MHFCRQRGGSECEPLGLASPAPGTITVAFSRTGLPESQSFASRSGSDHTSC